MFKYLLRLLPSKKKLGAGALRKAKIENRKKANSDEAARVNNDVSVLQFELHTSFLPYSY